MCRDRDFPCFTGRGVPVILEMSDANKLLLIGWDAADWRMIRPLLGRGLMPHMNRLLLTGSSGNIATLQPMLSPMLWTSIATGKRPFKHGVLGFTEPDPVSGGIRPVTNLSRRTKALWNILNQNGRKSTVVGWWPSHPVEPLSNGVMVSNHYQRATTANPCDWKLEDDGSLLVSDGEAAVRVTIDSEAGEFEFSDTVIEESSTPTRLSWKLKALVTSATVTLSVDPV